MSHAGPPSFPDMPVASPSAVPAGATRAAAHDAIARFELLEVVLAELSLGRGQSQSLTRWAGQPLEKLRQLKAQSGAATSELDKAIRGFALTQEFFESVRKAITNAQPIPPI